MIHRVSAAASGVAHSDSPSHGPLGGAPVIVAIALLLGLLLHVVQFDDSLQWGVGLFSLSLLALYAWRQVLRGTADPAVLVPGTSPEQFHAGGIGTFARTVQRAIRGFPFSQVLLASRARAAFLERASLALGVSAESLREAQSDPADLRRLIRDDVLVDFLVVRKGDFDESERWFIRARGRGGFERGFRDVLDRMEGWR